MDCPTGQILLNPTAPYGPYNPCVPNIGLNVPTSDGSTIQIDGLENEPTTGGTKWWQNVISQGPGVLSGLGDVITAIGGIGKNNNTNPAPIIVNNTAPTPVETGNKNMIWIAVGGVLLLAVLTFFGIRMKNTKK